LDEGADLVIRSAGSKGPADLIAIFLESREVWFIQVKGPNDMASKDELTELAKLAGHFKARSFVIFKRKKRYVTHELKIVEDRVNTL